MSEKSGKKDVIIKDGVKKQQKINQRDGPFSFSVSISKKKKINLKN